MTNQGPTQEMTLVICTDYETCNDTFFCHHKEKHIINGACSLEWYGKEKGKCPNCIPIQEAIK